MSSAGTPGGGGGAAPRRYFCHQCDRTVTLTASPTSELACPICDGGFLEEFDIPTLNPNPHGFFSFPDDPFPSTADSFSPSFPLFFSASSSGGPAPATLGLQDLLGLLSGHEPRAPRPPPSSAADDPEPYNPIEFVRSRIEDAMARGANIQFVIENHPTGDFHFPGAATSFGDYFFGSDFEQLIQQLAENDPNRYGTPPASKSAVESLPDVIITEELLASDEAQCAVCKDTFEIGTEAKQMPCKHIYHKDCILPWLELHNSCPVCRYELPTDDPDYEHRMGGTLAPPANQAAAGVGDSGGAGPGVEAGAVAREGNSPRMRSGEWSMRISLPGSLRAVGSLFGVGNSGGAGGNSGTSSGGGDANSGGTGGRDSGSETRQEDLD